MSAVTRATAMSPEARTYLAGVLDVLERRALHRDRIDWPALRGEAGTRLDATIEGAPYPTELLPRGRLLGDVGYLELPIHLGRGEDPVEGAAAGQAYAAAAHAVMCELDPHAACGWVVDLRRNR